MKPCLQTRKLSLCCFLGLCVVGIHTYSFEFEVKQPGCQQLNLQDAVNNQVAYNIIYTWNRFGVIHDWKFEEEEDELHDDLSPEEKYERIKESEFTFLNMKERV